MDAYFQEALDAITPRFYFYRIYKNGGVEIAKYIKNLFRPEMFILFDANQTSTTTLAGSTHIPNYCLLCKDPFA